MLLIPKQVLYILDAGKFYQFWQQVEELVEGMPEKRLLSFRNFFTYHRPGGVVIDISGSYVALTVSYSNKILSSKFTLNSV